MSRGLCILFVLGYHGLQKNPKHKLQILQNKICKRCSFECGKYSTRPRNKVWAFRRTPYSLDMCCIFPYRTKMNTVCIFSHDCPKFSTVQISVQLTDMTDGHKTRGGSVNSIHGSPAIQHAYSMYTCSTEECGIGWSRYTSHSGNTTSECEKTIRFVLDLTPHSHI